MSTSTTPLHPNPRPHTTSSSVVVSYVTSVGCPVRMTLAARSRTSPSRHPPLTTPVVRPSSVTSIRAPGRLYAEPSTRTTVASAALTFSAVARRYASMMLCVSVIVPSLSCAVMLQEFVERDRQLANSLTGCVIDSVGNCGRDRNGGELAHALHPDWAGLVVEFTDEQDVELRDIRVRRHEITGKVAVQKASQDRVGLGLLEQRLSDAPDDRRRSPDCVPSSG